VSSDPEHIEDGDVFVIELYDVHAYERIKPIEIDDLEEPEFPRCWRAVVLKGETFLPIG